LSAEFVQNVGRISDDHGVILVPVTLPEERQSTSIPATTKSDRCAAGVEAEGGGALGVEGR
jgi:hypothetical protein